MKHPSSDKGVQRCSTPSGSTQPGTKSGTSESSQTIQGATVAQARSGDLSRGFLVGAGLLGVTFLWLYWPTLLRLVHAWNVEPDYSHGYFVLPLAIFFLWIRRDRMPEPQGPGWFGMVLIAAALAVHLYGSLYYLEPLNGWSMSLWLIGAAWLLGGRRFCQWSAPSALFLLFMVPLPFGLERAFRQPLQRIATQVSCWLLQSLGFPALSSGNVISIEDAELEVAQACSGLRIFVSIVALAFAYTIVIRRPWWTKVLVLASALPIAIIANSIRVTIVGLGYSFSASQTAHAWVHDVAGWFVIPLAAGLMGAFIWYLGKLVIEVRPLTSQDMLRR